MILSQRTEDEILMFGVDNGYLTKPLVQYSWTELVDLYVSVWVRGVECNRILEYLESKALNC